MEINKKQAGTILIAALFIVSGISFAVSWNPASEKTEENTNVLKQPIANEQRSAFMTHDVTILTLFYLEDDSDSNGVKSEVEKLNDEIGEKMLVEEIDVETYQSFSAEYNIRSVPTIIIRGKENINAPSRLEGPVEYAKIKEKVCATYSEKPTACE